MYRLNCLNHINIYIWTKSYFAFLGGFWKEKGVLKKLIKNFLTPDLRIIISWELSEKKKEYKIKQGNKQNMGGIQWESIGGEGKGWRGDGGDIFT